MKKTFITLLLSITFSLSLASLSLASTVSVDVIHSQDHYQAGTSQPIIFRLNIKESWYIHGPSDEGQGLIPTILSLNRSSSSTIHDIRFPYPDKKEFDYTSEAVSVYSGNITVKGTLSISENGTIGTDVIEGFISFQACSDKVCLPPEKIPLKIDISIVRKDTPVRTVNSSLFKPADNTGYADPILPGIRPGTGFWLTLLLIFLGGLALNLTPCIYPLIPITVSYFGGRSDKIKRHAAYHGIVYLAGLSIMNSFLGVTSALSGGMLGSALQNPIVLIVVSSIMIILSLFFFGLFELRIPGGLTRLAARNYKGYFGTFFMGLTLGIVAAPCLGPFILGLFTYVGQLGDPLLGFLYFFILSIGIGLPLCILGVFSGSIDLLPKSGDWMVWVRYLMGWVMVGMAIYIVSPLISSHFARSGLYFSASIAAGIHLGWLNKMGKGLRLFPYLKKIIAIVIMLIGLTYLLSTPHGKDGIQWIPYSQEVLNKASSERNIAVLDFYADWCLPCKELDHIVFGDPEVIRLSQNAVMVRLDLTQRRPFQKEILSRYDIRGVPTIIFFNEKGIEKRELRVESFISKDEFIQRLKTILMNS